MYEMNGPARRYLLSQQVYNYLKTNILNGVFRPDERLIENKLADKMGLSRTPVREAISKLEQEGLVYRLSMGGCAVSDVKEGEISEERSIPSVLLVYAVYLATLNSKKGDLNILRSIMKSMEKHLKTNNKSEFVRSVIRFCETLLLLSKNTWLSRIFNSLKENLYWDIFAFFDNDRVYAFLSNQRMLIDLMEARQAKNAVKLARELYGRLELEYPVL